MFPKEVTVNLEFDKFLLKTKKKYLKLNFNCPGGSLRTDYAQNADTTESGPAIVRWNELEAVSKKSFGPISLLVSRFNSSKYSSIPAV